MDAENCQKDNIDYKNLKENLNFVTNSLDTICNNLENVNINFANNFNINGFSADNKKLLLNSISKFKDRILVIKSSVIPSIDIFIKRNNRIISEEALSIALKTKEQNLNYDLDGDGTVTLKDAQQFLKN